MTTAAAIALLEGWKADSPHPFAARNDQLRLLTTELPGGLTFEQMAEAIKDLLAGYFPIWRDRDRYLNELLPDPGLRTDQ